MVRDEQILPGHTDSATSPFRRFRQNITKDWWPPSMPALLKKHLLHPPSISVELRFLIMQSRRIHYRFRIYAHRE